MDAAGTLTRVERFACPCCAYPTLDEKPPGTYAICEVCFWEDDQTQFEIPTYRGGASEMSLLEARESFAAIGAVAPRLVALVRPPTNEERRGRAVPRG